MAPSQAQAGLLDYRSRRAQTYASNDGPEELGVEDSGGVAVDDVGAEDGEDGREAAEGELGLVDRALEADVDAELAECVSDRLGREPTEKDNNKCQFCCEWKKWVGGPSGGWGVWLGSAAKGWARRRTSVRS